MVYFQIYFAKIKITMMTKRPTIVIFDTKDNFVSIMSFSLLFVDMKFYVANLHCAHSNSVCIKVKIFFTTYTNCCVFDKICNKSFLSQYLVRRFESIINPFFQFRKYFKKFYCVVIFFLVNSK